MEYNVDIRDLKFQLFEWLDAENLLSTQSVSPTGTSRTWRWCSTRRCASPSRNWPRPTKTGDRIGAVWDAGKVTVPESYQSAYKTLCEGGWIGSTANPELGGLGLARDGWHCDQ